MSGHDDELRAVAARYARRDAPDRYSLLRPEVWQMLHERQRASWQLLATRPGHVGDWHAVEVGCGDGGNLLELLRLGMRPAHVQGVELLPARHAAARAALPPAVRVHLGDAVQAPVAAGSQDLVIQSTVFTSILDAAVQQRLADAMWHWLKPGGGILWYDFTVDNPRNPDVRGVPLRRVKALFPGGRFTTRRITLAPPIARRVVQVHPSLYTVFNALPLLRTHLLAWIEKPGNDHD